MGIYFLRSVIVDVVIDIYEDLQRALERYYPDEDWTELPPVLRYASWIGGDRDGNPNVTTDVTLQTLSTLRNTAREMYLEEVSDLANHLTQGHQCLWRLCGRCNWRDAAEDDSRFPGELYRTRLTRIGRKLEADAYRLQP